MLKTLKAFIDNESGATTIEYAMMAALIGLGIIAGAAVLGDNVNDKVVEIAEDVDEAY